jgi:quinoprotein dehydrogenase-associated probable ABC transporter substrate-binding protein
MIPLPGVGWLALRLAGALVGVLAVAAAADPGRELRICADPDNLPFSNDRLEGFENKIAQVVADELHAVVQYAWFPQRTTSIPETLEAGKCDLVIGVPTGWDLVLTTKPYYRSTYVFVYLNSKHWDLSSFDDPLLRKLRIGVHAIGKSGNLPPAEALADRGLSGNVVGFSIFPTEDSPAGEIIDAVAAGKIDVAVVWGPLAGYFAKRQRVRLAVTPISDSTDSPFRFTYDISLGLKRGDAALREKLEGVLDRRHKQILKALEDYGVPLVPLTEAGPASAKSIH